MKIANVKGMVAKGMMVILAAGALIVASPATASAERFAIGVQVGTPYFGAPYYGPRDRFEFERRQEFLRHEEWLRMHRFARPYGYR
jgi:hypothetical protein